LVNYIVRVALVEETNDGWVWICGPSTKNLDSRTIVTIKRPNRCRGIYTEVRVIDKNFLSRYNNDTGKRVSIDMNQDTVVMSEWYRKSLAINLTTKTSDRADTVALVIRHAKLFGWSSARAACHHPDTVVRLATRLGLVGVWLGVLSIWLGLLGAFPTISVCSKLIGFGLVLLFGVLSICAAWGRPTPLASCTSTKDRIA